MCVHSGQSTLWSSWAIVQGEWGRPVIAEGMLLVELSEPGVLEEEIEEEQGVAHEVPRPEPPRLLAEPVEPLEAAGLHPGGSLSQAA